ncbi:MAG: IclR family transcriptional regulator [Rubellimicrobium sp.]|nr:IclR family transcriptional regulator [Rubellimicrobium sp.]
MALDRTGDDQADGGSADGRPDRYRAPALDKGLDILELLAEIDTGISQAEIAKTLGRSANEIYRMLDTLVRRGYVRRSDEDRYDLTLKLFDLSHRHRPVNRLVSLAMPVMRAFARDAGQACHLVLAERDALVVVAQVDGPDYWNLSVRLGARVGLIDTGSGHVILAWSTPEEQRTLIAARGADPDAVLTPAFRSHLAELRARGYEDIASAQVACVRNLSVPVLGPTGRALAALTCPYTERLDRGDAPDTTATLALLATAAARLSQRDHGTA